MSSVSLSYDYQATGQSIKHSEIERNSPVVLDRCLASLQDIPWALHSGTALRRGRRSFQTLKQVDIRQ